MYILITQFLPVLFQWFEHTGIQRLGFMGSVGWETENDYVIQNGLAQVGNVSYGHQEEAAEDEHPKH